MTKKISLSELITEAYTQGFTDGGSTMVEITIGQGPELNVLRHLTNQEGFETYLRHLVDKYINEKFDEFLNSMIENGYELVPEEEE